MGARRLPVQAHGATIWDGSTWATDNKVNYKRGGRLLRHASCSAAVPPPPSGTTTPPRCSCSSCRAPAAAPSTP
nr:unnamed protein product [Digitaria exilis]